MCGTLNNAAFSTPCMRLFAASRPNSATPQTVGLVAAACLHVITKASQTFNVHAHRSSLPECTKHQPSIIQYINIRKLLSRIFFIFFTLNCHGCPTGSRSALIFRHLRLWRQPLPKIKYGESKDNIKTRRRFSQMFLWYGLA